MIFSGPHYYFGLIQAALVIVEILAARFLVGKNKTADRIIVWLIGAYFLFYKSWEYGPFENLPLDLSAMSYFLFGIAAFVPFRPLKAAASFSAMLSGVVYAATLTLYPESHFNIFADNVYYLVSMAMVNHNLMLVGGIILSSLYRFQRTDYVWVLGWLGFFMGYVLLLSQGYGVDMRTSSILGILQGTLVASVLGLEMNAAYYVVYYIIFFGLFAVLMSGYCALNRALHKKDPKFLPSQALQPQRIPEWLRAYITL